MIRLLLEETATQTLDEMAMELAARGVDELTKGDVGSCENAAWPEYKDWE
jgi:hypothetical protein